MLLNTGNHVTRTGTGSWVVRLWQDGRSIDRDPCPIAYATLAQAKSKAFEWKAAKYLNRVPALFAQPAPSRPHLPKATGLSFEVLAAGVIQEQTPSWKDLEGMGKRWAGSLERQASAPAAQRYSAGPPQSSALTRRYSARNLSRSCETPEMM